MLDKLKELFDNKNEEIDDKNNIKKKNENLIFFLVILVITLIIINKIISVEDGDNSNNEIKNNYESELIKNDYDLESKLENILGKISGVGNVKVMITYSESSRIMPIYNETSNSSLTEENASNNESKKTESSQTQKDIILDSSSKPIVEKTVTPKVEGAIITAQGANNSKIKEDIILAVEAVTGLASHKIQVFCMD